MAELVDPEKLVSLSQVAKKFGFHPKYLCLLAAKGKLKAWRIGNMWVTLPENVKDYVETSSPPGRPPQKGGRRKQ
ncbi:MAG: helix-turn-helix domain-containing protein [Planctomycetes bacterium]|nr:helix-turn-helix domain-containing protein [Planctomycetota bacterium]